MTENLSFAGSQQFMPPLVASEISTTCTFLDMQGYVNLIIPIRYSTNDYGTIVYQLMMLT